jgi:hypothetical protein
MNGFGRCVGLLLSAGVLAGCADDLPTRASSSGVSREPIGMQMARAVPDLRGQRYTNLLHFETQTDSVFVTPSNLQMTFDESRAHTGKTSLMLRGNGGKLTTKLSSLLGERPFPADWTLGGAYFYSEQPAQITVICDIGGRTLARNRIELPPKQWAAVMVDLSNPLEGARNLSGLPSLSFIINTSGEVWCDDVLLIDNTHWIIGEKPIGAGWSLRRLGFNYLCERSGTFSIRLPTVEFTPGGWKVEESNHCRARFSSTGKNKSLTIYSDGRSYWDGKFQGLSNETKSEPLYAQQQDSPAEIQIEETMGRVERRSAGDENNDGYNEIRGAYMLSATGPRLEFNIVPRTVNTYHPVFEISGMPEGKVLATVEGRLVEQVTRVEDGTVLVEIPTKIARPTTVNLRVQ